jgi:hypothetical protein
VTQKGSIRDRVVSIRTMVRDGALTPDMARESQMVLTALLSHIHDEERDADAAYKPVLLAALQAEAKANRARIVAECSPEYRRWKEARDASVDVTEMIRSCRAYLRSLSSEMELAR